MYVFTASFYTNEITLYILLNLSNNTSQISLQNTACNSIYSFQLLHNYPLYEHSMIYPTIPLLMGVVSDCFQVIFLSNPNNAVINIFAHMPLWGQIPKGGIARSKGIKKWYLDFLSLIFGKKLVHTKTRMENNELSI